MNPGAPSLADKAYAAIKEDILTCALDPGAVIAQPQLIERYNLGMTPVREALKRLEQEGYLSAIPRQGYLVSSLTLADVHDLYELRILLEQQTIRLAVLRATDDDLRALREKADFTYTYHDTRSYREFLQRNADFHHAIALTTGNARLAAAVRGVLEEMERIFHLGLELRDSAEEMRREHQALVQALAKRDAGLAQELMTDQIARSQQRVTAMLERRLHGRSINELPIQPLPRREA
mgnify:CR=1 FL=1